MNAIILGQGGAGSGGSNNSVGPTGAGAPPFATEIAYVDGSGNLQEVSIAFPLPVAGSFSATLPSIGTIGSTAPTSAELLGVIDGSGKLQGVGASNPVRIDPTGTTVQPVSGTITANQGTSPWVISGAVTTSGTATVSGTVAFSNTTIAVTNVGTFAVQATLAAETTKVIGTVNQGTSPWVISGAVTNAFLDFSLATIDADIKANITLHAGTNVIGKVSQDTSPWVISGAVTTSGTATVIGTLTNNNAAPSTNNLGVLPAVASAKTLVSAQGNLVALSTDLGGHLRVRNREASSLGDSIIFGERTNQVELNFSQAFDAARVTNTVNTTGSAVQGSGAATYSTGTGAAGAAKGISVATLDYRPGHELYAYFTASFTAGASSSHQRIGPYNGTDGFWIGYEGTVFGITQFQNGVMVGGTANTAPSVARASFNGDPCTGLAGSQFTSGGTPIALDLTKINIWRIRGSWFGTAPIMLDVFCADGIWVTLHSFYNPNTLTTPYAWTTNWNLICEVVNAGNTTNLAIVTPCWSMGTTGNLEEISDPITDISLSLLTRSVIAGKLPAGLYANVALSTDKALQISGSGNFAASSYTFDPTHTVTQTIVLGASTYTTLTVEMTGTGSTISAGQLTFQGSLDNSNWVALWPFDVGGNTPLATAFYAAATGTVIYQFNIAGFPYVRVLNNVTVAGTGTPQVVFSYSLESLSTPSSVAITASNIHVSSAQGNAAAVSGAWPILVTDGTNTATVKAASTAAIATDSSLVVQLSPNQPALTAALNVHDASPASQAVTNAGTFAVQATLAAETTKVIGVVRNADGSGNLLTSTSNALDINIKSGSIANTSFIATQATGTNLHAVVDSGTVTTVSTVTAVTSVTNPVSTKTALTPSAPTAASVGVASGAAVALNANRKGLILVNTSVNYISLGFGANAAVLYSGITLNPQGGTFVMDEYTFTTVAVNAIASGATSNLAIQEIA